VNGPKVEVGIAAIDGFLAIGALNGAAPDASMGKRRLKRFASTGPAMTVGGPLLAISRRFPPFPRVSLGAL